MSKTLITIFILFLPLLYCKKKEILNASNLIELLKSNEQHYKAINNIIIIPGSGCQGCISNAENMVLKNAQGADKEIKYLFTNIISFKLLKLRLDSLKNDDNIIYDLQNSLKYTSIYPCIIFLKDGKIIKTKEQELF